MHKQIAVAATWFGLMTMASSSAQRPDSGQIRGHVVDVVGATISGANVFLHKNSPSEDHVSLVAHSDSHGDFVLLLPEGGYDVLVTSPGFASRVETVAVFSERLGKLSGS